MMIKLRIMMMNKNSECILIKKVIFINYYNVSYFYFIYFYIEIYSVLVYEYLI